MSWKDFGWVSVMVFWRCFAYRTGFQTYYSIVNIQSLQMITSIIRPFWVSPSEMATIHSY